MINYAKKHPELKKQKDVFSSLQNIFANSKTSFEQPGKASKNLKNLDIKNINTSILKLNLTLNCFSIRDIQYFLLNVTGEEFHRFFMKFYQKFDRNKDFMLEMEDLEFILK